MGSYILVCHCSNVRKIGHCSLATVCPAALRGKAIKQTTKTSDEGNYPHKLPVPPLNVPLAKASISSEDLQSLIWDLSEEELLELEADLAEGALTGRTSSQSSAMEQASFAYVYCTDQEMTSLQGQRHRVLALCSHFLACRIVIVTQSSMADFFGRCVAQKHVVGLAVT